VADSEVEDDDSRITSEGSISGERSKNSDESEVRGGGFFNFEWLFKCRRCQRKRKGKVPPEENEEGEGDPAAVDAEPKKSEKQEDVKPEKPDEQKQPEKPAEKSPAEPQKPAQAVV